MRFSHATRGSEQSNMGWPTMVGSADIQQLGHAPHMAAALLGCPKDLSDRFGCPVGRGDVDGPVHHQTVSSWTQCH